MQKVEIIETISGSVSCFGKKLPFDYFDHPKIYLQIDPNKQYIICPYCSKKFILINKS
jgi:uncharacterized Zn-finger protein